MAKRKSNREKIIDMWKSHQYISINGVLEKPTFDNIAIKLKVKRNFVMQTIVQHERKNQPKVEHNPYYNVWMSKLEPYYTNEFDYGYSTVRTYREYDVI